MTAKPAYIDNTNKAPHWRGNDSASLNRAWFAPTGDLDRAIMLAQLSGALMQAESIAKALGTTTQDYEITITCLREDAQKERRAILEGVTL